MSTSATHEPPAPKVKKAAGGGKGVQIFSQMKDVFSAVASRDYATRRMAWFFLFSLACAGGVLVFGVKRASVIREYFAQRSRKHSEESRRLEEFIRKKQEAAHQKAVIISAGVFTLELKTDPTAPKIPGISNLAELEIVLQCDTKETQEFIEKNLPRVRNEIISSFIALERSQILSKNGKQVLRRQIMDHLNHWLPHGKIADLFFAKLLVT